MPESFIQVPPNSTGARMRTRSRVVSGNTVHESAVYRPGADTWYVYADNVAAASAKSHVSIFNGVGSGMIIQIRKLFVYNLTTAAVSGAWTRFDLRRSTAQAAGTAITPVAADTTNPALPVTILAATGATVTDGGIILPFTTTSEENTVTQALSNSFFQQMYNLLPEADNIQEVTLREGQGFNVRQVGASTVGIFGWAIVMTVEAP